MRRAEEPEDDSMPGQDSFIDVICNMVGILITLVVVVGMRVSQIVIEPPVEATRRGRCALGKRRPSQASHGVRRRGAGATRRRR